MGKSELKDLIREEVRKALQEQEKATIPPPPGMPQMQQAPKAHKEPKEGEAWVMMAQLINSMGIKEFSQAFVDRMGDEYEDDIRAILSYIARQEGFQYPHQKKEN